MIETALTILLILGIIGAVVAAAVEALLITYGRHLTKDVQAQTEAWLMKREDKERKP